MAKVCLSVNDQLNQRKARSYFQHPTFEGQELNNEMVPRILYKKDWTMLLTTFLGAFLLLLMIDAKEQQDEALADITGA